MDCPSCGKKIPAESVFCLYCGEKILFQVEATNSLSECEYKEIFIPNEDFSPRSTMVLQNRIEAEPTDLQKLWENYLPQIAGLLERETDLGWEPDPNFFGANCLVYEIRSYTFKDYKKADWIWLIVLSILSVGIYLLFVSLVNATAGVIKPKGVNMRLRRVKL